MHLLDMLPNISLQNVTVFGHFVEVLVGKMCRQLFYSLDGFEKAQHKNNKQLCFLRMAVRLYCFEHTHKSMCLSVIKIKAFDQRQPENGDVSWEIWFLDSNLARQNFLEISIYIIYHFWAVGCFEVVKICKKIERIFCGFF